MSYTYWQSYLCLTSSSLKFKLEGLLVCVMALQLKESGASGDFALPGQRVKTQVHEPFSPAAKMAIHFRVKY